MSQPGYLGSRCCSALSERSVELATDTGGGLPSAWRAGLPRYPPPVRARRRPPPAAGVNSLRRKP